MSVTSAPKAPTAFSGDLAGLTYDVARYTPEDGSMYELVAHLPDKSNNYLTPALVTLEKNT